MTSNRQARKLDVATPEPGYGNFGGPGFLPSDALGGWTVGNTARRLPNDMGRYLKKGRDLVVQVHYHPTGRGEVISPKLDFTLSINLLPTHYRKPRPKRYLSSEFAHSIVSLFMSGSSAKQK